MILKHDQNDLMPIFQRIVWTSPTFGASYAIPWSKML
jgi:hypothetical protein